MFLSLPSNRKNSKYKILIKWQKNITCCLMVGAKEGDEGYMIPIRRLAALL